jgi:TIR domain
MAVSVEAPTRVFISYRREDTAAAAAHLHDSLVRRLGVDEIFRDVDSIASGQNFETVIAEALRVTSVRLVVIGPAWVNSKGRSEPMPGAPARL